MTPNRIDSLPGGRSVARVGLALLLGLTACAEGYHDPAGAPEGASGFAAKPPVRAERQMVVAAHPLAAEAGLRVLREGGSALDAAIAAQMVLGLVEPQSSGLGGGGFLLHFAAKSGEIAVYDGRETAPAAARPGMFLNPDGGPRGFYDAAVGGLSVGVPGLLRMLETAHQEHGRTPWLRLLDPAIRLAEDGFPVGERLARLVAKDKHLQTQAEAAAYFYDAAGKPRPAGSTLRNPAYAETLRAIARGGADAFYSGPIAEDIVRAVREAPRNPGAMTRQDLALYQARKRDPLCLPYRVWLACGVPPPSSGGIAVLQMLGILEHFDLAALKPNAPAAVHLLAEAGRLAFADRDTYVADPAFVPPPPGLLDPGYLALRGRLVSPERAMKTAEPGMPGTGAWNFAPDGGPFGVSTTHLSVIDKDGNAVALTSTIESAFGSRLMVRGFLLNNQLTDFAFRPEAGGAPVVNQAEPGKRPRSSMAPTLVFDPSGRVKVVAGSPGGARIIGYVARALVAVLDWNMDPQAAVSLPHALNRNGPTEIEKGTPLEALRPALEALGHEVKAAETTSGLHLIVAGPDGLRGGADPRREGTAAGD